MAERVLCQHCKSNAAFLVRDSKDTKYYICTKCGKYTEIKKEKVCQKQKDTK